MFFRWAWLKIKKDYPSSKTKNILSPIINTFKITIKVNINQKSILWFHSLCSKTLWYEQDVTIHAFLFKAIGAAVEFAGNVSFTNNNAKGFDGGALYMLTFSQITLATSAHLEFINNTGGYAVTTYYSTVLLRLPLYRLGASIVVVTGTVLSVFAKNYYNPLCFIQYPDPEVPPVHWEEV